MLTYESPSLLLRDAASPSGQTRWKSPSNLALIKYWGKYGRQLPRNPSISFTLNHAATDTVVRYQPKQPPLDNSIHLSFTFEGQTNESFRTRLVRFLGSITSIFPFLTQLELDIASSNSFPHSAGIASSASAMSALALCLCSIERDLFGTLTDEKEFLQKASFVARLGSGSACRSVYPTMAVWGETEVVDGSSNLYAVPFQEKLHPVFKTFHDDILIVSKGEKSVSSSAGHQLMEGNIFAHNRYAQARQRFADLAVALEKGDLETFGQITENEALTLHALMMTSEPSYILMEPNSLAMIQQLRNFRRETGAPIYFSLDAGPNLHLLYPDKAKGQAKALIKNILLPLCENGVVIEDVAGPGPEKLGI